MPLTTRDKAILAELNDREMERRQPPTFRELCRCAGISSTSVVYHHIRRLERDGLVRKDRDISRGLALTERAQRLFNRSGGWLAYDQLDPVLSRVAEPATWPAGVDPESDVYVRMDQGRPRAILWVLG